MSRFRGSFLYLTQLEYEFDIEANSKEEVEEQIKNDALKYLLEKVPVHTYGIDAHGVEFYD